MRIVVVGLLAVLLVACAESLEFPDWSSPPPEGVRVVEYRYTPDEERTESIGLAEDLVLGFDDQDPEQRFYGVRDVDVDDNGNLWVLDAGNHRVQMFDRDGGFVRSIGRQGQGPGEFESPAYLAVVGDRLVVRAARSRLSVFDLEGNHLADATLQDVGASVGMFSARPDGTFLASYTVSDRSRVTPGVSGPMPAMFTVSVFSLDGEEVRQQAQLEAESFIIFAASTTRPAGVARAFPSHAASSRGDVYASDCRQYQVLAFDPDGAPTWALRTTYVPAVLSDEIVERALESARTRRPETTRNDLIWPDRLPALSHVAVDGHGHLYVYPYYERGEELEERPVDVYSAEGELLFSGKILDRQWRHARGDFVYAAGSDRVTGELLVWRWKLEEPF